MNRSHRHRWPVVALLLSLALLTGACGSDEQSNAAVDDEPAADGDGGFPVTIEHAFGSTTIEEEPERVVTVGFNEQDFVLALGVTPVGTREYMSYDYKARPWAQDALGGEEIPEVSGGEELNFEKIAASNPEVIIANYSFIEDEAYEKLAAIAPTVAQSADYPAGGEPWQVETRTIGTALGRADEAEALVEEVEAAFEAAKAAYPDIVGKTVAVDYAFEDAHYILEASDLRNQFFNQLGSETPEVTGELSQEQLRLLDQDLLVVVGITEEEALRDPLFANLAVVKEGRTVFLGLFSDDFGGALGFGSPLSLPYAIDVAAPRLAAAADGDPATKPEPYPGN